MAVSGRTYVIVGAGIAGLTTALALSATAERIIVLERHDGIQEFGAGLQIGPNARHILNALGLDMALESTAFEPEGIDVYAFGANAPLVTLALGEQARAHYGVPYTVMHRAGLAGVLHSACLQNPNIEIRFNVETFEATPGKDGVTVHMTTTEGDTSEVDAYALIGADGVGSMVRKSLLGGPEADYTGYVAWRALLSTEALQNSFDFTRTSLLWGHGYHAVVYPLAASGAVNIALFTREKLSVAFGLRKTPNLPADVRKDPRFAAILECNPEWTHWPLAGVRTATWHKGPIGLVGDAAHAMLPFQAQGAAMGIEDAAVLAAQLEASETAEAAFSAYVDARQSRVARVARTSTENGRIFHMRPPLSLARNVVVRAQGPLAPYRRLNWLYDYRV